MREIRADPLYRHPRFSMDLDVSRAVKNLKKRKKKRLEGAIERCPQQSDLDGSSNYSESIEHTETTSMDQNCDNSYRERKLKRLNIQPSYREVLRSCRDCLKIVFQRKEKHRYECNQTCYSTRDPKKILSSQKHLSSRKMLSIQIQNTHTHTH